MASKRNMIVAGVAVLAAALVFAAWKGLLPYPPSDTQGSIGAAKRYQAGQVQPGDVQLSDAQTQAFLQSDIFHKLQTDENFRKLVAEKGYTELLATAEYRNLFGKASFERLMADPATGKAIASERNLTLLRDPAMRELAKGLADAGLSTNDLGRQSLVTERLSVAKASLDELSKLALDRQLTEFGARVTAARVSLDKLSAAVDGNKANSEALAADAARLVFGLASAADVQKHADVLDRVRSLDRNIADVSRYYDAANKIVLDSQRAEFERSIGGLEKLTTGAKAQEDAAKIVTEARTVAGLRLDSAKSIDDASKIYVALAAEARSIVEARSTAEARATTGARDLADAAKAVADNADAMRLALDAARVSIESARSSEFERMVEGGKIGQIDGFKTAVADRQVTGLVNSDAFKAAIQDIGFARLLASRDLQNLMADASLQTLLGNRAFVDLAQHSEFAKVSMNDAARQVFGSREFAALARDVASVDRIFRTD